MSCMVTTTVSTSLSSSERNGVALTRTVIDRPSGTLRTISSARTVSPLLSNWARGRSARDTAGPSKRRTVRTCSSSSGGRSGSRTASIIRTASRLKEIGAPVRASKDRHTHGRGVNQRLQARPGAAVRPCTGAGVGDDHRRLGREHHQYLLVLLGIFTLLLVEVDGAQVLTLVADWSSQKGPGRELAVMAGGNSGSPSVRAWLWKSRTRSDF